jgi:phosphoenolpyruvate-protein kinase (PTS system EI component)
MGQTTRAARLYGADASLTAEFLEMGVDELSMEPSRILPLRKHIAGL